MTAENDWKDQLKQAVQHHQNGDIGLAKQSYQAVLKEQPDQPDALHLLGVLFCQEGDFTAGVESIEKSLAINPIQPGAHNNLGNAHVQQNHWEDAARHYELAVALKPEYAEAHKHLGNVYDELKQLDKSIEHYSAYLEANPSDENTRLLLAEVYEDSGAQERAVDEYRRVLRDNDRSSFGYSGLGSVLRNSGRLDEARQTYAAWLSIEPDNPQAQHFSRVGLTEGVPARASDDYVRHVFDGVAEDFDKRLEHLENCVPELVATAVAKSGTLSEDSRVLDLGCGTGLCGRELRSEAGHLIGVDLSPKMIEQARAAEVYDELVEAEIVEYLSRAAKFDLIVGGELLIYLGELQPLFDATAASLRPGGRAAFSLEITDQPSPLGYRLDASGRFQHVADYLHSTISQAGMVILHQQNAVLRKELGEDVLGLVVVVGLTD